MRCCVSFIAVFHFCCIRPKSEERVKVDAVEEAFVYLESGEGWSRLARPPRKCCTINNSTLQCIYQCIQLYQQWIARRRKKNRGVLHAQASRGAMQHATEYVSLIIMVMSSWYCKVGKNVCSGVFQARQHNIGLLYYRTVVTKSTYLVWYIRIYIFAYGKVKICESLCLCHARCGALTYY